MSLDLELINKIDGWLTSREAFFLYSKSRCITKEEGIVEISSWKGKSTTCLAMGSKDGCGTKVFAIDPHTGSSEHIKAFGKMDTL